MDNDLPWKTQTLKAGYLVLDKQVRCVTKDFYLIHTDRNGETHVIAPNEISNSTPLWLAAHDEDYNKGLRSQSEILELLKEGQTIEFF